MNIETNDADPAKIFIVDDNPRNLQVVGGILQEKGCEISMALNGTEALSYLKDHQADLVLLDIMMPEMDGFEVCRAIRNNPVTQDIPVIFLTASNDPMEITKGFETGAVDYVTKPFQTSELLARINTHLELSRKNKEVLSVNEVLEDLNKQLMDSMRQLKRAAETDPLTSLFNRRRIGEIIKSEEARVKRGRKGFSVILADIDDFKRVNDDYGHDCGDFVLQKIAMLFRSSIREQDRVARWGGEEFLFLLPETDLEGARHLAEKICLKVRETPFDFENMSLSVTATFGISFHDPAQRVEDTIKKADLRLFKGKNEGKNRVTASG